MSAVFNLKARLQEMGISPKRALGQNFLVNPGVIDKIIEQVMRLPFQDLLEIGPGLGALTEPLLQKDQRPRLIELDRELMEYWRSRGLDVIDGDALKINWDGLTLREPSLLVSNLPYQISTHLVIDRCLGPSALKWMVLMFQKEVAERLMAVPKTKDYGVLSVMAQLHFKMRKVADASLRDFYPAPKVASRVLYFERLDRQMLGVPFLKFVKQAFHQRRKFLLKNLGVVVDKATLARVGLSEKVRAEELDPETFAKLFKTVYEHKDHHRK